MTADLDTLLRDAGREPTIDVDADALHTRGRRRSLARRTVAGVGVLAVVGAVALGVSTLAPEPTPFIDDAAPSKPAPSEPAPSASPSSDGPTSDDPRPDHFTAEVAMADLGVTVVDVVRSHDGAGGLHLRLVTSDGVIDESSTLAGGLPPAGSTVVVDHDLRVWANDVDPNLLRGGFDEPLASNVAPAEDGLGWGLLGSAEDGRPLVTRAVGAEGQLPEHPGEMGEVLVWGEEGPEPIAGITGRPVLTEATPIAAAAVAEQLAVLSVVGETSLVDLHPAGADPFTLAETGGVDRWFTALAIVEGEVWITERTSSGTDLWLVPMDGARVRRVPTPVGRDGADREVVGLDAIAGPDGPVATLSVRGDDRAGTARTYLIDVEGARAAAVEGDPQAGAAVPGEVFRLLDAEGQVHLLPVSVAGPGPREELADCATEDDGAYVNGRPVQEQTVLYYLCWDAVAQLPEGVAHPFVPSERPRGPTGTTDADGLLDLLRTWAAGPTPQERAAGLTGGLDPAIATIADVALDGATVTVDLVPGDEVGILGTTNGSGSFTGAVVGMVLQYEQFDAVTFTLEGSCEDFGGLVESLECLTYDESQAPWAQAGGA